MARLERVGTGAVLVVGPIYVDTVFAGLSRLPHPGEEITAQEFGVAPGGYAISALALHRLGLSTTLCGEIGRDLYGDYLLQALNAAGLPTHAVFRQAVHTNVAVTMNWNGDRGIVSYGPPSAAALEGYRSVVKAAAPGTMLLLSVRHPHAAPLVRAAKEGGLEVALSLSWHPEFLLSWPLRDLLAQADLLFCNVPEALLVTQEAAVEAAGWRLAGTVPEVVITRGPEGAEVVHGQERDFEPAFPAVLVDATGAGDVFAATYLAARAWGWDYPDRLRAGNFCAGHAVERVGSAQAALSRTAVEAARAAAWNGGHLRALEPEANRRVP